MRLHYLQHVDFEGLGVIDKWADNNNHQVTKTSLHKKEQLPKTDKFDILIITGGPMNVYQEDRFPWLKQEKEFITEAITDDKLVLGVCLGAQLIADCLGAKVYKNKEKEIGWFNVVNNGSDLLPKEFMAFHWHSDTFDIPNKAINIAESQTCQNQAFSYNSGKVLGLQFHLELTKNNIDDLINECRNEITNDKYVQSEIEIKNNIGYIDQSNALIINMLNTLIEKRR
ncbi:MAG: type 1 glutamine amidotransferase [Candidatus Omnitrophica bacterium]|nr:type 1 glutamine amidotransferase [Candidatus Omnitrophota bacterium]